MTLFNGLVFQQCLDELRLNLERQKKLQELKKDMPGAVKTNKLNPFARSFGQYSKFRQARDGQGQGQSQDDAEKSDKPVANSFDRLPIDDRRDEILEKIAQDRVVVIHGETGCGKSSRLPVMLYEDALATGKVSVDMCSVFICM